MAWAYADFEEQDTDALVLARLKLHITEVRNAATPDVTDGEVSVNRGSMVNLLASLNKRRAELEARVRRAANGPIRIQKDRPGSRW